MIKFIKIIFLTILFLAFFGWAEKSFAANHYVSPNGNASWSNSTNISAPASLATAFANATAGDLVYFRGGIYTTSGNHYTSHSGTGDAENQRVVFRAYPGETPNIVNTNTGQGTFMIEHNYWWFDGLTIHSTFNNAAAGDRGVIYAGYNQPTTGLKVTNCHLVIDYTATGDNVDCCLLKSTTNALIQNNLLEGYAGNIAGGVIFFNGIGNKVLNNEIKNIGIGIYQKHPNCDTGFETGIEFAYNYVHDIGASNDGGFLGQGSYINLHDNIVVNSSGFAMIWGSDGGNICAQGHGMLFNHNTFRGTVLTSELGMPDAIFKNNILSSYVFESAHGTWDYNIYNSGSALGAHDQGNTSVTFVGGATPATISGYALTSNSNGYLDGDDGKDLGADISLVGIQSEQVSDATPPSAPSGLSVQ